MPLDSYYLYKKKHRITNKNEHKKRSLYKYNTFHFLIFFALISVIKVKGHECNDLHNNNITKKNRTRHRLSKAFWNLCIVYIQFPFSFTFFFILLSR